MKKLILILILLSTLPLFGQVRLSTMDSITTFGIYDYSYWNALSGGAYLNRKVSWTALRAAMIDYIDGLANTWALKQTYSSGATFSAGANGGVTVSDTLWAISLYANGYPYNATSYWGFFDRPFYKMYSREFVLVNPYDNDSVTVTYDDSTLTFDKKISVANLTVTSSFNIPDSVSFSGFALSGNAYTPSRTDDSVITLGSTMSSIILSLPGAVTTPGIEKIVMTNAGNEQMLTITNRSSFEILLDDGEADGNLVLGGSVDFTMGVLDIIVLKYDSYLNVWVEVSRSNN